MLKLYAEARILGFGSGSGFRLRRVDASGFGFRAPELRLGIKGLWFF